VPHAAELDLTREALKQAILASAHAHGFELCRVVTPESIPEAATRLRQWLAAGHHAGMGWMGDTPHRRESPRGLWPEVRSILMLGLNYGPDTDPMATLSQPDTGTISVYARGKDYHDVVKSRLKAVARDLVSLARADVDSSQEVAVKVFVDTAPVLEKPLAEAAGLGWQGKHTVLVSRELGNWLFLGAIFITLDIPADVAETDHCGTCRRCLDACPTGAFPAPYVLDSRRCISYLTIEHKGHIAEEFRVPMGNRIYGCDDCLAVCPWNKFAEIGREARLAARADLVAPRLADLAALDDARFRQFFSGSPIKRTGRDRFVRNVLIAIGNSGDAALAGRAEALLHDPSALVRAMAVWALWRLLPFGLFERLRFGMLPSESDPAVRAEWGKTA
jgi:epoxyqueuosine reductase